MEAERNLILKLAKFSIDCQSTETDFLAELKKIEVKHKTNGGYDANRNASRVVYVDYCAGASSRVHVPSRDRLARGNIGRK